MKTVWKYKLKWEPTEHNHVQVAGATIAMPMGAEVVHFAVQTGSPCIWAIVDTTNDTELRSFAIVGTGHALPGEDFAFRRTTLDGPYVWHLFERVLYPIPAEVPQEVRA